MIRFCSCSGGSATPVQLSNYRASSKVCKGCGGKLLVDRRRAISESMLSTVGMQLSRVIDPNLNWKVCPKGRQRALRRARTCFNVINHCKVSAKSLKGVDELTHNDTLKIGHLPVSESEKLGVSILGRRFSETPETVPFKKRKVPLVRSPSPPAESRCYLSDPDHILDIRSSYCKAGSNATQQSLEAISGFGMDSDLQNLATYEVIKSDIDLKNADFSGISLLAAAACDSNLGDGRRDVEDSSAIPHTSGGEGFMVVPASADPCVESAIEGICQFPTDMLDGRSEAALDHCVTSALSSGGSDKTEDNALQPSEDVSDKTMGVEFSSRDDRLHWDLNIVMDAWDDCHEIKNSEPSAISEDCAQDVKVDGEAGQEKLRLQVPGDYDTGCHEDGSIESGSSAELSNFQAKAVSLSDHLAAGHDKGKERYLLHGGDYLPKEKNQLEGDSTASLGTTNNECPLHCQDKNGSVSAADPGVLMGQSAGASFLKSGSVVKTEYSMCSQPNNNVNINCVIHACEALPTKEKGPSEVAHEKTIPAASSADIDHHFADTSLTVDVIKEATDIRSLSAKNNVPLYTNGPGDAKDGQCPAVDHDVDESSYISVDGNMAKTMPAVLEIALTDDLDQTVCADAFGGTSTHPSDPHPIVYRSVVNLDEVSAGSADMDIEDSSCPVLDYDKLDLSKADSPVQTGSEYSRCISRSMPVGTAVALQAQGPSISLVANASFADNDVNCSSNVAMESHVDVDYDSDASQTDDEHPVGMEKVDSLGDDASPYEDGEFRESVNGWGADGETENMDYGSDHKDHNIFEVASVHPHFNNSECKNGRMLGADEDGHFEQQANKKFTQSVVSCFPLADSSEAEVGKKCYRKAVKGASGNCVSTKDGGGKIVGTANTSTSGSVCHKNSREPELLAEGDGAYLKMRSTGWDRLPEGCGYGDRILNSNGNCAYQNHTIDSAGASKAGESLRKLTGASLRKNLPSQIDKSKSSDVSYNKNNSYLRTSRVNDDCNSALKGERDGDDHRSVGRGESPLNRYSRGRVHRWVDGHNHWSQYGPAGFTHSSSKNAAAAAVAKVESNGFVVAPDGTLVKAGGLGPSRRVVRHNASSQNTYRSLGRRSPGEMDRSYCMPLSFGNSRESPDRHISSGRGRAHPYGPQMQRADYRKSFDQLDDNITSSLPVHRPLSRREHSFSPQERPPHMLRSHTGSASRSRTRSPHNWTSSRRSENRRHGGPSSNFLNRSQNFKSQDRLVRVKSPQQGSGFRDHISPVSRDRTSTPTSRWMNERKDLLDFREHGYKQSSERSPVRRLFSRSHRVDQSGSPRRLKQEEYHQPAPSGRFAEFVGANRSSRHDGNRDDRRGNVDRYEMIHSVRQYDNGVSRRQFHYDFEDGFRVHPRAKVPSNFEQRGNSRDFDREVESQLGDSARVTADKKGHFRFVRDGKHSDNDKLHEIQQCSEDMDLRMGRTS